MSCSIENCNKKIYAKGWCRNHYRHVVEGRHSSPLPIQKQKCDCGRNIAKRAGSNDLCRDCYSVKWKNLNKESLSIYKKQYDINNKAKIRNQTKEWRLKNKDKQNAYYAEKRKNPQYRLAHNLRSRLYDFLKGKIKHKSTENLTGCSFVELKKHLEDQFTPDMTWENYGSYWCVDHIVPLISIDLNDRIGLEQLSHYSNLRPLTITENSNKATQDKACKNNF